MSKMTVSLPDGLQTFVDERAAEAGFDTGADYVSDLVQRERDRQRLRASVLEGAETPIGPLADVDYFDKLRVLATRPDSQA